MKALTRSRTPILEDELFTLDEQISSSIKLESSTSLKSIHQGKVIRTSHLIDSSAFSQDYPIDTREADRLSLAWASASLQLQKASEQMPTAFYDYEQPYIAAKITQDITDTLALRRAIHSISNFYNTLGVYRSDFDKSFNDLMSRTAIYAMCEKAMMDYMGSVPWSVIDAEKKPVETAVDFLEYPNPQENFGTLLKMTIRDLMRYDAGVFVKSFSRGGRRGNLSPFSKAHANPGYLLELKSYSGPEFWKEIDRVPMSINIPTAGNVPIQMTEPNSSHYTGWWSHGYTVRYWQRSRTGVYLPFQPEELCYFMMYPVPDQIYGTDFIKFLRYQLQYLIESTKAAGVTFQNGVVPNMIWKHPQIRTTGQLTERIAQMQAELRGPMKFGGAMHLIGDEDISTAQFSLHDMEWLEGQKHFEQLVWAMWGFSPTEFIGESENRATAYVKRNITKSRLLYPLMYLVEQMFNREVLPYLQDYKKGWRFEFVKDIDLDDQQKISHTTSIRLGGYSVARSSGMKPSLAYKIAMRNESLSESDLSELDKEAEEQKEMMQGGMEGGMDGDPEGGDMDQGRYGQQGGENYESVNLQDGGQGNEEGKQRFGEDEEAEHKNTATKAFHPGVTNIEVLSEAGEFVKARVYVKNREDVPSGRTAYPGARGAFYYLTKIRKPHNISIGGPKNRSGSRSSGKEQHGNPQPQAPDLPGDSKKCVKITGNGVAFTAAEYSYGIESKAAKNDATKKFITWLKPQVKQLEEDDVIDEIKRLAKKEGLIVHECGTE
jgi:hypothetical protein